MRLLVLGASGGTGRELVRQAVDAGHEVTALVRETASMPANDAVTIAEGSVTDEREVDDAVRGHDAVLSALGVNSPRALIRPRLMQRAMAAVAPAMSRHGVKRLVLLSALGVGPTRACAPIPLRMAFATALRGIRADKEASEEIVRRSDLDWTVVYPPALGDGAKAGIQAGEQLDLAGVPRVSRAAVAGFMLEQLSAGEFVRGHAVIGPA